MTTSKCKYFWISSIVLPDVYKTSMGLLLLQYLLSLTIIFLRMATFDINNFRNT